MNMICSYKKDRMGIILETSMIEEIKVNRKKVEYVGF